MFPQVPGADRGPHRSPEQSGTRDNLSIQPQMASNKPQWPAGAPHAVMAVSRDKAWHQQQQDIKHREYLKQQQRLKVMGVGNNKNVSADTLIGSLLEKKDTFRPKHTVQGQAPPLAVHGGATGAPPVHGAPVQRPVNEDLPPWIWPGSPRLPPIYTHIWTLVVDPSSGGALVDTNRIFPLLLTSGLPTQILGFIWNLAAQGVPGQQDAVHEGAGQLTQQQLYVVLALVALAQTGCTFNSLGILKMLPQPPMPMLNMAATKIPPAVPSAAPAAPAAAVPAPLAQSVPMAVQIPAPIATTHITAVPVVPPTPPVSAPNQFSSQPAPVRPVDNEPGFFGSSDSKDDDDFADDFTDFQSADVTPIPPSSVPTATVVQPSSAAKQVVGELNHSVIARLGNQGRSIGSRLANHTLGAPKASRSHHHRHHRSERRASAETPYFDDEVTFGGIKSRKSSSDTSRAEEPYVRHHQQNSDSADSEDFSEFQTAIGLNVNVDELFPKCKQLKKRTVFLKESAIRNGSDESNDAKTQPEVDMLSLDSPSLEQPPDLFQPPQSQPTLPPEASPPKIAPPINPPPLIQPPQPSPVQPQQLIQSPPVQVPPPVQPPQQTPGGKELMAVQEDKYSALRFLEMESTTANPSDDFGDFVSAEDSFAEIAERRTSAAGIAPLNANPEPSPLEADESKNVAFPVDDWLTFQSESSFTPAEPPRPHLDDLTSVFSSLNMASDVRPAPEPQTDNTRTPVIVKVEEVEGEFGDFVGLNMWSGDEDPSKGAANDNRSICSLETGNPSLSRHGSLPSLDLKIFPQGDDSLDKFKEGCVPINEWQRCLDCCVSLLQAAVNMFTSISSQDVVLEVLGTTEGRAYCLNLKEVRNVCNRIRYSYHRCGQEWNQIETCLKTAQQAWDSLERFYHLADIDMVDNESREDSGVAPCCICCCPATTGALVYNGHSYHASCANLWLNCV